MRDSDINTKAITSPDEQDTSPVKAPAGTKTDHRKRRRRPGPKRKDWMPNPYGRYPLSSSLKKYTEAVRQYYRPNTLKEITRKTRRICQVIHEMGGPQTPKKFKEEDIRNFIDWMDSQDISNETKRKYLRYLKDFLAFHGNDILSVMITRRQIRVPSSKLNEITSLSRDEVKAIHESSYQIDGWDGAVARFITLAYPYTGLRPSEMRTMKFSHVNTRSWTLVVSHPKGEGIYGVNRRVGIPHPIKPAFKEFLEARDKYLKEHGFPVDSEPLIPRVSKGKARCWLENEWWLLKDRLERLSGIKFKIKDYRSTFCQWLIDNGAQLEAVSKVMGHSSSKTTEGYYGRIGDDAAISEIDRVFMEPDAQFLIHPVLENSQGVK